MEPSPYLSFNVHIDGMRETHDRVVDRNGVFDTCVRMIKMLKERGYRVQTNSTIFRETGAEEIEELVKMLGGLGVDGMLLTPGYHYQVLTNDDIYLKREEMPLKFKRVRKLAEDYKIINTPIYLDYLVGDRDLLVQSLDHRHAQSARLEGPLLPDHQRPLQDLRTDARGDRLGVLPHQAGYSMPRLQAALRLRGHRGAGVRRESEGLVADGAALYVLTVDAAPRTGRGRAHGQYEDDLAIRTE